MRSIASGQRNGPLEVAHSKGTVPTRVRYNWITEDGSGKLKAVGYHTTAASGRDQVRVRMLEKQTDGSYEFWGDERTDKPFTSKHVGVTEQLEHRE